MLLNFESWETTESFDSVELPAADREEHDCEVVVTAGYFTAGAAEDHRCAAD